MGLTDVGGPLVELASGIDALYLSGRGTLPVELLARLAEARLVAEATRKAQPFSMGGYDWQLQPFGLLKYRYRLEHEAAVVGITPSSHFPPVWVQARAEALHSVGAESVVSWVRGWLANEGAYVVLAVSRLDLHSDWQGWDVCGDDRQRFVCRARALATYEDDGDLTGFSFGNRKTGSMVARIYDKTREIEGKGNDWWFPLWGDRYDPTRPVTRVEFEFEREALREMELSDPEAVFGAVGELWAYATQSWLTYRDRGGHSDRSRWPISPAWTAIQESSLALGSLPRARIDAAGTGGGLRLLMPLLNGCVASFASWLGVFTIAEACDRLPSYLASYELVSKRTFEDRVRDKIASRR